MNKKKKIILSLFFGLLIFALLSLGDAFAAPTCGVHMPKKNTVDFGFESYVLRNYKTKDDIQAKLKGEGVFMCLSYGIVDWLVLDLKFGSSSIRNDVFSGTKYDYDANWGGAYGFRWQLYKNDNYGIKVITGLQHLSIHPKADNSDTKRKSILDDSQAQLLISKLWKSFDFYIGVKSTIGRFIRKFSGTYETKSLAEHISAVVGTEFYINDKWHLNLEGRFLQEDSFTVGMRYQF